MVVVPASVVGIDPASVVDVDPASVVVFARASVVEVDPASVVVVVDTFVVVFAPISVTCCGNKKLDWLNNPHHQTGIINKFRQSGLPTRDSLSRRILKVCALSRVEARF